MIYQKVQRILVEQMQDHHIVILQAEGWKGWVNVSWSLGRFLNWACHVSEYSRPHVLPWEDFTNKLLGDILSLAYRPHAIELFPKPAAQNFEPSTLLGFLPVAPRFHFRPRVEWLEWGKGPFSATWEFTCRLGQVRDECQCQSYFEDCRGGWLVSWILRRISPSRLSSWLESVGQYFFLAWR